MSPAHDVVVVGGGPAGLAAAGTLARGGRSVVVFERSCYDMPRVGESLGPELRSLLQELGAWGAMEDLLRAQAPFTVLRAEWGNEIAAERSSIENPLGEGWHLDRVRFDARLAEWARSVGVEVRTGVGRARVARGAGHVVVATERGGTARGRFLLDASGRGAPAGAGLGDRVWLAYDRQVALVAHVEPSGEARGVELLLEAVEDGWWYSVPQPDHSLVAVWCTDADLLAGSGTSIRARFENALSRSRATARRVSGTKIASVRVVRADSGRLIPDRGHCWRAVGDAALASDPLAGNGVSRALRTAMDAARSLDSPFDAEEAEASFERLMERRATYYLMEQRWVSSPFWMRRQPRDVHDVPLSVPPEATLTWCGPISPRVEAILPPRAIAELHAALASPALAHTVLTRVRAAAPVGARRLLVGLELLVESGAVRVG